MGEVVSLQHRREVKKTLESLLDIPLDALLFIAVPYGSDENILGVVAEDNVDRDNLVKLLDIQKSAILSQSDLTSPDFPSE